MDNDLTIRRVRDLADPALPPWLDLYQASFPLAEQVLVSQVLRAVTHSRDTDLVMAAHRGREFIGLAWVALNPPARAAALWYLAIVPSLRCQGLGRRLLDAAVAAARAAQPDTRLVGIEVDRPDLAPDEPERTVRGRRIGFYQRAGAVLRDDIAYVQCVGWQPPLPMHLMVLPLQPLTPAEQYDCLVALYGLPDPGGAP